MLVLCESAGGYALFSLKDKGLSEASEDEVANSFKDLKRVKKRVALEAVRRFKDVKEATEDIAKLQEGSVGKVLKSFIKKKIVKSADLKSHKLAVWDKNLAADIRKKFDIELAVTKNINEIFRGIRTHMDELITGDLGDSRTMSTALSHSLSRFKLKFSPEKVDVMVIQAVGLLDDLDKELNNLVMRLREWYGFHFPELLNLVDSPGAFAKLVLKIGYRSNVGQIQDFTDCNLTDELEQQIRRAAETSMGSDLTEEDLATIKEIATRVLDLYEHRTDLTEYLRKRMEAIAPNLTHMVGETLGAKLLAHAGSLMDLAKQPASTVQILGAEKALFRALKARASTPKYGLIYHAKLVGQASPKLKGKMSRILANKIALCVRTDACGEETGPSVAIGAKSYCERRLEELSQETMNADFAGVRQRQSSAKYVPSRLKQQYPGAYDPKRDSVKVKDEGSF